MPGSYGGPDLPNKAREGRLDESPCIFCGHCQSGGTQGSYANCTVNMGMGKELDYRIEPAVRKKNVMVIGGGPAGMEAARTMAERGHDVTLYEKSSRLGGQWRLVCSFLPEKRNYSVFVPREQKAGSRLSGPEVTRIWWRDEARAVVVATVPAGRAGCPGDGDGIGQAIDVWTAVRKRAMKW